MAVPIRWLAFPVVFAADVYGYVGVVSFGLVLKGYAGGFEVAFGDRGVTVLDRGGRCRVVFCQVVRCGCDAVRRVFKDCVGCE